MYYKFLQKEKMRLFSLIVHLIAVLTILENNSIRAFLIGIDLGSDLIKVINVNYQLGFRCHYFGKEKL